jgi:hypothetical protein
MDKGVDMTQRLVIGGAVLLGIIIVFTIGYSLYTKAKIAEGELATKVALDNVTKKKTQDANISLTSEAKNTTGFTYDGLVQKKKEEATTTKFEIVNEQVPVEVPAEEAVPPDPIPEPEPVVVKKPVRKPVYRKPVATDNDRPLTLEEIQRIRQLPVDSSPSGNLQTALESESQGQYKARY